MTIDLFSGGLFLGKEKHFDAGYTLQLGLNVAMQSDMKMNGFILDDAVPNFDNDSYQYKISSKRIAIQAMLIMDFKQQITPWVMVNVSLGLNRSYNFSNTSLIVGAIVNNNFTDNVTRSLHYSFGAGLQKNYHSITTCWCWLCDDKLG